LAITYDTTNNIITVTGYTEAVPCTFNDLWLADKAGLRQLLAPTSAAMDLSLTTQPKPTDKVALKLNLIITGFSVAGSVTLTGKDKDNVAQTETIDITSAGTFVTTKWWLSIDALGIDCTGTYTIEITQSQWGVVWKTGTVQFKFDCRLIIGDGTTATWLKDTLKEVHFYDLPTNDADVVTVMANAYFVLGTLVDESLKITKDGCDLYFPGTNWREYFNANYGYTYLYSCSLHFAGGPHFETGDGVRVWNCLIDGGEPFSRGDWYNTVLTEIQWLRLKGGTLNEISILTDGYIVGFYYSPTCTVKNLLGSTTGTNSFDVAEVLNETLYAINFDLNKWTFNWETNVAGAKIYRQYEFDLTVTDKDNNPLANATVTLKDKDGNTVFTVTTDGNGAITTQTVSRGYYQQSTGNTLNEYSPHTLTISKDGFKTYIKTFTLSEKTKWQIKLSPIVNPIFVDGKPALNLSETDSENELYATV